MQPQEIISIIYICLSSFFDRYSSNAYMEELILFWYRFQIRKTKLVRKHNIVQNLDKMIEVSNTEINKKVSHKILKGMLDFITKEGDVGVRSYLSGFDYQDITSELILLLDAARSALTFSETSDIQNILELLSDNLGNSYVE